MRYPPTVQLPDSPDSHVWREVIEHIQHSEEQEAMDTFRFWCWNSFWFFCRYCLSFGDLICRENTNAYYGKPWADHPWVFDRCMHLQDNPNDQWFQWPRFYFKTALITQNFTIWEWIRDVGPEPAKKLGTDLTTLVLTYKVAEAGEGFLYLTRREVGENERLKGHWPDLFYEKPAQSGEWTLTSFRIRQRTNPKEPTMLVAGLDNPPTGGHYRRIVYDDPVVRETVRSQVMIEKCFTSIQQSAFLIHDDTEKRWVGTHWAPGDPWAMCVRRGMFDRDHIDCYDKDNQPVLRSREFLADILKMTSDFDFAAQMRGDPIALSAQRFQERWVRYYDDPLRERKGKNVHIFVDTARETKDHHDYTAIVVVALGADRKFYVLDMYREKMELEEYTDLLFRLVVDWEPICVWIEQYGAQREVEHIKYVQEVEGYRFRCKAIPARNRTSKVEMIQHLQRAMQQGRYWFAFKYGRKPRGDTRDVMVAFIEDELRHWTPEGGAMHDDLLDVLSSPLHPKFARKLPWPDISTYRNLANRVRDATQDLYRKPRPPKRKYSAWAN